MSGISESDLEVLTKWDTPTICNALELVAPERRATGFTSEAFSCLDPKLAPVVGYARTATIRAATPPAESAEVLKSRRARYYEYLAGSKRRAPGRAFTSGSRNLPGTAFHAAAASKNWLCTGRSEAPSLFRSASREGYRYTRRLAVSRRHPGSGSDET